MKLKFFLPVFFVCALLPVYSETEAAAGKSYVLVSDKDERTPGLRVIFSNTMTMTGGTFSVDTPQGALEGVMEMKTKKVLDSTNVSASKIKAVYTTSTSEQKMTMNGQEIPQAPKDMALVDVPVLVTLKDGSWSAVREDGETASLAEEIELNFLEATITGAEGKGVYGTDARKPGDTWEVDPKAMKLVSASDDAEGSITMKFEKVAEHEGVECAFLSGEIKMLGSPPSAGGDGGGKLELDGKFEVIRSLEHQIDLFREMKGTMKLEMPTPGGAMRMSGPVVMQNDAVVKE